MQGQKSLSLKTRTISNVCLEIQAQVQIPHTISTDAASKVNLQIPHWNHEVGDPRKFLRSKKFQVQMKFISLIITKLLVS